MASSGSFSGSICSGHYVLRIDWSQAQNVSANTSTITAKIYLVNDWRLDIGARTANTISIGGTSQGFTSPAVTTTGEHLLDTVTQTVTHESDGSKSISISAVFSFAATISGTYYSTISASANITLDSIPRASDVSMPTGTMGSSVAITITPASSSFTHTLTYTFGSLSGTISTKTTATTVNWTPALTMANQLPNATSGTGTLKCTTYSGNTAVGSKSITITLKVPTTVVPSLTSLTAARVNGTVPSSWGIYVQTKSKATLTINGAAGSYGSTITGYSITGGGFSSTSSSFTTGFLNTSGTITFTATVTDSRGRTSAAKTVSISVVAYSAPSFASYLSQRCNSSGTVMNDGTYVRGLVDFTYSSCSSKNTITTATYYKKSSATSWTNASKAFSDNTAFTFGGSLTTESSYDIKYTLTDAFTTISVIDTVSTASVVMDFKAGGTGVAIGKVAENNGFDVDMATEFRSTVKIDGTATFGGDVVGIPHSYYGTCATAASTSIKVVTCAHFKKEVGAVVTILMTYANTVASPRLNINSTGASYLSYGNVTKSGAYRWLAGSMLTVMYTGSYYEVLSIGATWVPTVAGASTTYNAREGYFTYTGGVVTLSFTANGSFLSTTTTSTALEVTGFPFTNASAGVAAGGGVAYGAYLGTNATSHFHGWVISSGASAISGRNGTKSAANLQMLGYLYNNPSTNFNLSGTIQMRVI